MGRKWNNIKEKKSVEGCQHESGLCQIRNRDLCSGEKKGNPTRNPIKR